MFGKGSKKSASGSSSAKAGKEDKNKYPDYTTAEKKALRDATSLTTFLNTSENLNAKVIAVRIVVHTTGYRQTHDGRSGNHWSIFLILEGQEILKSVRLNMVGDGLDYSGHLQVTDKKFHSTTSRLEEFDYPVASGKTVIDFCTLIRGNHLDRYMMTGTGNGCRFWVYCALKNFLEYRFVPIRDGAAELEKFNRQLWFKYHRHPQTGQMYMTPSDVEQGHFY